MPEDYLTNEVFKIVVKAYMAAGQTPDNTSLKLIASEMTNDIYRNYSMLSIEEITEAFYHGVRYNYGEYFGLNIVTFNKWLKHYLENEHGKYVLELSKTRLMLTEKTEPTDQEKEDILKAGVKRCYDHYKQKKEIIDYGNPIFDYLYDNGKILLTDIQWNNYLLRATREVMGRLQQKSVSVDRIERQDAKRALINLESDYEIQSLAKRIALAEYFDKFKSYEEI